MIYRIASSMRTTTDRPFGLDTAYGKYWELAESSLSRSPQKVDSIKYGEPVDFAIPARSGLRIKRSFAKSSERPWSGIFATNVTRKRSTQLKPRTASSNSRTNESLDPISRLAGSARRQTGVMDEDNARFARIQNET